jgi:hypothetical protein
MWRYSKALTLAASLGLGAAIVIFTWSAHDFGPSCGWQNLPVGPNGPTDTGRLLIVIAAAAITIVVTRLVAGWPWLNTVMAGALGSGFAAAGIFLGELAYALARNCFAR